MASKREMQAALGRGHTFANDLEEVEENDLKPLTPSERAEVSRVVVQQVPIEKLLDNPYQHLSRDPEELTADAVADLATQIRELGFQRVLVGRPKRGERPGTVELAFGHRSREAARSIGLATLPVKVVDLSDEQMFRLMAGENLVRENVKVRKEVELCAWLAERHPNYSSVEIGQILGGRTKDWIDRRLALSRVDPVLLNILDANPRATEQVLILNSLPAGKDRNDLAKAVEAGKLSASQLRRRISTLSGEGSPKKHEKLSVAKPTETDTELQEILNKPWPLDSGIEIPENVDFLEYRNRIRTTIKALRSTLEQLEATLIIHPKMPKAERDALIILHERLGMLLSEE